MASIGCLWVALFAVAIPLLFIAPPFGLLLLGGGIYGLIRLSKHVAAKRLADLTARFGAQAAALIVDQRIWQGATRAMIIESIGSPVDIDERVMKTTTRHTFKYHQTGKNKFGLRITFEDDICVGWDDKR